MKGIPDKTIEEIEKYFFSNKENTAGTIAKKFGLKQWQADKIVNRIQVKKQRNENT